MPLRFLTSGESHGPALVAILDGMIAGLTLNISLINNELARRQSGYGAGGRMKIEKDTVTILGGVMNGLTTGAPISLLVQNDDHIKWKNKNIEPLTTPRPGHADLTGVVKFGYTDLRPTLERSSARETTMRVAVGSICKQFLAQFGISVIGYVREIGEIEGDFDEISFDERFRIAELNDVRCPDLIAAEKMRNRISEIMQQKDTLGGIIEIVVQGLPVGLGSYTQWDKRLEAKLGAAILSVQAMKGIEFGDAWENARIPGTKAHDSITLNGERIIRPTNRAGGIEGGISNGQPIVMRVAMKPIATTLTPQITVDLSSGIQGPTKYERSDFCPVPRAIPILESMASFVIADVLLEKLGGDSLNEILPRFNSLRQAILTDLKMDNNYHIFWE